MNETTVGGSEGRYSTCGFLFHAESGQVLLHHRDGNAPVLPDVWSFFCGGSEPEDGGDPAATWCREMAEELGIVLRPEQVVFLCEAPSPITGRRRFVFYSLWPHADESFVLGEGDGFGWFTLEAALALPDLPAVAKADLHRFGRRLGLPITGGAGAD
ncbi:MAG TPA: NUDIX domain-containing protein [Chloroflexota bacterium]|nr:NUDIX domain-containing protein [Chloroflexota bacterium]